MTRIGLVLSGGGARGIAHLGVIKALEENSVRISRIAGTSAGAIVGAFYASGYSPDEIFQLTEDTKLIKHLRPALNLTGLVKIDGFSEILLKFFPDNSFGALKIPLTIAATDINKGVVTYFERGDLTKAILASSCIPVIFDPIKIEGRDYVDGGITDNFPINPIRDKVDVVIGSHTNFIGSDFQDFNMKSMLERTMLIAISGNVYPKTDQCDLFIDPPGLSRYAGFDVKKAGEIFEIGYHYTHKLFSDDPGLSARLVDQD